MNNDTDINNIISQAEQGNAEAQYNLGVAYELGEDVPENPEKAIYWVTKAAEQTQQSGVTNGSN